LTGGETPDLMIGVQVIRKPHLHPLIWHGGRRGGGFPKYIAQRETRFVFRVMRRMAEEVKVEATRRRDQAFEEIRVRMELSQKKFWEAEEKRKEKFKKKSEKEKKISRLRARKWHLRQERNELLKVERANAAKERAEYLKVRLVQSIGAHQAEKAGLPVEENVEEKKYKKYVEEVQESRSFLETVDSINQKKEKKRVEEVKRTEAEHEQLVLFKEYLMEVKQGLREYDFFYVRSCRRRFGLE